MFLKLSFPFQYTKTVDTLQEFLKELFACFQINRNEVPSLSTYSPHYIRRLYFNDSLYLVQSCDWPQSFLNVTC